MSATNTADDDYRPDPSIIEPTERHTHTFIFLHGLGSTAALFKRQLLEDGHSSSGPLPALLPSTKFIFPSAKLKKSSLIDVNMSMWFDIISLKEPDSARHTQLPGLLEEAAYLREMIEEERMRGIPAENIVIGGLSQGCAMSCWVVMSLEYKIGGLIGMSGWLPYRTDFEQILRRGAVKYGKDQPTQAIEFLRKKLDLPMIDVPLECSKTPVFLGHGALDEKVKYELGEGIAATLGAIGFNVHWKAYLDLGHWYKVPDEIDDILVFLSTECDFPLAVPEDTYEEYMAADSNNA